MSEANVPDFRVLRGNPTAEEVAAIAAVLAAVLDEEATAEEIASRDRPSAWERTQRSLRGDLDRANGWRSFPA
jgi:hypothetical protein